MRDSTQIMRVAGSPASAANYQKDGVVARYTSLVARHGDVNAAIKLLILAFRNVNKSVAVRLWNGTTLALGNICPGEIPQTFTLVIRNPDVVSAMILRRDPLYLADAYFCGDIDIEGDFFAAVSLKDNLRSIRIPVRDRIQALYMALRLRMCSGSWPVRCTSLGPIERHAREIQITITVGTDVFICPRHSTTSPGDLARQSVERAICTTSTLSSCNV